MNEWNDVSAAQPLAEDVPYLTYTPRSRAFLERYQVLTFSSTEGWMDNFGITHWMELPPPPEVPEP